MKFNKNKCFFASVYVAAVSAMTFTGFTSYAAEQNAQINETLSLIRGEEIQWGVSDRTECTENHSGRDADCSE